MTVAALVVAAFFASEQDAEPPPMARPSDVICFEDLWLRSDLESTGRRFILNMLLNLSKSHVRTASRNSVGNHSPP